MLDKGHIKVSDMGETAANKMIRRTVMEKNCQIKKKIWP